MPAPYPRRGPQQGQARAVNRGAQGMAGGKFSGLSPVVKGGSTTRVEPPPAVPGSFTGWLGYQERTTGSSAFTNGSTLTFGSALSAAGSTSWLTMAASNTEFDITETGIYFLTVYADTGGSTPGTTGRIRVSPVSGGALLASRDIAVLPLANLRVAQTFPLAVQLPNPNATSATSANFKIAYTGTTIASGCECVVDLYKVM